MSFLVPPTATNSLIPSAYIRFIEQPVLCEEGLEEKTTTPFTIDIVGYQGKIKLLVSCITSKPPYKPHPYNLSGPNCKYGFFSLMSQVTAEKCFIKLPKLTINCVKRRKVREALNIRKAKNVDPFLTGFEHSEDARSINLNVIRLCVQVILRDNPVKPVALTPVVSDCLCTTTMMKNSIAARPHIEKISHRSCCVLGNGKHMILLCNKVSKTDIKIRFFETRNDSVVWEDYGTFNSDEVHSGTAICFKPPVYYDRFITKPARVSVQLLRPSDGVASVPVDFEYLPSLLVLDVLNRISSHKSGPQTNKNGMNHQIN